MKMALLAYVVLEGENSMILILAHFSLLLLSMLVVILNFGISQRVIFQLPSLCHSNHWDRSLLFVDIFYAGNLLLILVSTTV